jgi:asparagine synthase (glutamine-hydrolysing)
MCGIVGYIGAGEAAPAARGVERMLEALARRGPDDEGRQQWALGDRTVELGHRRLSIFDLSPAGHQPMCTPDDAVGVVFNGAIYNWRALRAELERDGAAFRSRTDTEVLLHGYRAWGMDGLVARLHGMFAFALWDAARDVAFLVRDRLGVKPLAYARRPDGGLAFASTVRALRRGGYAGAIDDLALADVLEYGYVDEDRSIWQGAHKLPPATILEWRPGAPGDAAVRTRRYWTLPETGSRPMPFEAAVDETERLLLAAVEMRLDADVPVGALLSGGVDSALVCWAIRRLGADVSAFTVGTPGHASDESDDAAATAREIGIPHRLLALGALDESILDELVAAYPEPFAVGSALGMLRVSRAVRESATVLLTGDGGDDVFLGYPRHQMLLRMQRLAGRLPAAAGPLWRGLRGAVPRRGAWRRARHAVDYTVGGLGAFLSATGGLPLLARERVLGERLRDVVVPARRLPWSVEAGRRVLDDYLAHDRQHQFVAEYLAKVDGATMHWALEARSPFLDTGLWEHAAALPYEVRLHGGQLKAVLRELLHRRVGERAATGRKRGFVIPVERWVTGAWREAAERTFADSRLHAGGWIHAPAVLALLRRPAVDDETARALWYLLVLERWLQAEAQSVELAPGAALVGSSA